MEIFENIEQWNILGKMEQWNISTTEDEIGKDLTPYLDYVYDRLIAYDASISNELDTLKKILPRLESLYKHFDNERSRLVEVPRAAMKELFLLPGHCKLKKVLNDQTGLTNLQKDSILEAWKKKSKYHWGCMPLEDSTLMEERIRTNSAIISNSSCNEEFDELGQQFKWHVTRTRAMIESSFPLHTELANFEKEKDIRASSTLQLKRCNSTQVKRQSTKHKRPKSTSSPKASGQ